MPRLLHRRSQAPSRLARYTDTLGELMLRRQTEHAMQAASIESELANRAKSAFLGTMSHELRTPLNAIIGFSDLIRSPKSPEQALEQSVEYASYIGDAGRHLLEIVSDILDISKIESGAFTLNQQDCSIAGLLSECVPLVASKIEEKGQKLDVRIDECLPHLQVDHRRIKQILINLLSNANKYTAEGGRIVLLARPRNDGGVTVVVADNGIGMAPEDLTVAMTPFGQVKSHLSRAQDGAGLGLPIARGLAREHGGDLHLASELGVGTTAILSLPGTLASVGESAGSAAVIFEA